jgi:hypothetical protein
LAQRVLLGRVSRFNSVDEQPQVNPDRRRYRRRYIRVIRGSKPIKKVSKIEKKSLPANGLFR